MNHGTAGAGVAGLSGLVAMFGAGILLVALTTPPAEAQVSYCHAGFTQREHLVDESAKEAALSVGTRRSNSTGFGNASDSFAMCEGSVDYETVPEAAVADEDYVSTSGTLWFGDGEDGRLHITIIDDPRVEADEAFHVRLSNPQGEFSSVSGPATVEIDDNDFRGESASASAESEPDSQPDVSSSEVASVESTDDEVRSGSTSDGSEGGSADWLVADRTVAGTGVADDGDLLDGASGEESRDRSGGGPTPVIALLLVLIAGGAGIAGWRRWRGSLR